VISSRRRSLIAIGLALVVGLAVGLIVGTSEDEGPATTSAGVVSTGSTQTTAPESPPQDDKGKSDSGSSEPDLPRTEDDPQGLEPGPSGPAPDSTDEVEAADAARAYVESINARDGGELCGAFASSNPDELLKLPAKRGSCPDSFEASFGFKGKDGQPVWATSEMTEDVSAEIQGEAARVVATVFTKYADVREPTIEDDIIYLSRSENRWLVIKPSSTLYRSVGIADVPLEALKPPG